MCVDQQLRRLLDDKAKHAALELVHEEIHAFPSAWYRIYPSMFTDEHEQVQALNPEEFVSPLDEVLRDFEVPRIPAGVSVRIQSNVRPGFAPILVGR